MIEASAELNPNRATRFLNACWGRPCDRTPAWLMRQAGRYQPSYRALRKDCAFFELCRTPELAAQVTVNAVQELNADAAIIFSDILVPVIAMGAPVELTEAGPRLDRPIRDRAAIEALNVFDPTDGVPEVLEAIRLTSETLAGKVPLIGFAGAPLTLASYLVEGGRSLHFSELKSLLFCDPAAAHMLLGKLTDVVVMHLKAQVEAGCQAVQVFDSWAGILGPDDYRHFSLPYLRRIMAELEPLGVPRIFFGTGTGSLLEVIKESEPDVIGVDWRLDLKDVRRRLGEGIAIQGNLDPAALFMNEKELGRRIERTLEGVHGDAGYIFNLGHGVLPQTDPARARFAIDTVHRLTSQTDLAR